MARQSPLWAAVMLAVAAAAGGVGYHKYVEIRAALTAAEKLPKLDEAVAEVALTRATGCVPVEPEPRGCERAALFGEAERLCSRATIKLNF